MIPAIAVLVIPAAAGWMDGPFETITQYAAVGLDILAEPSMGLLPEAEAHRGKIQVTSAVLINSNTIRVSYSGVIAGPTTERDVVTCGLFGCLATGEKRTVRSSAGQYSDVVLNPGGAVGIRDVRYDSPTSHLIVLATGFSAAPDATGSLQMPAGGTWVTSRHSHTRDAAQLTVSDGQGPTVSGAGHGLDLWSGFVQINFNERITNSVDPSKVTIAGVNLDGAVVVPSPNPISNMLLTMTEAQRSELSAMQDRAGGLSADVAWGAATDIHGNKSAAASNVALTITKDTTPPRVRADLSNLNLDAGTLKIGFSEYVDVSKTDLSGVHLHAGGTSINLGGGSVLSSSDGDLVTIQLTERQRAQVIAPSAFPPGITYGFVSADSFPDISSETKLERLSLDSGAFRDLAGIRIQSLADTKIWVANDISGPAASSTTQLHLGDGTLRIEFGEYIDIGNADISKFYLSRADGNGDSVSLDGAEAKSDGDTVIVSMTETQRQKAIQMAISLQNRIIEEHDDLPAEHQSLNFQTSLLFDMGAAAVKDLSGNPIAELRGGAVNVNRDNVGPSLVRGSLDTGTGVLTLEFNEAVVASRIGLSDMSLRAPPQSISQAVPLWSGLDRASVLSQSDSPTIQITLTENQRSTLAGAGTGTLYLAVGSGAARDISGNSIAPYDRYTVDSSGDTTGPSASSASLHGGTGVLSITFDETIDASVVEASGFFLRGSDAGDGRTSLESASVRDHDATVVEITLSEAQRQAAFSYGTLLLDADAGAARDTAHNPSSAASGVSVAVSGDGVVPNMESASFNAGSGILTISFSETIKIGSVELSKITMHDEAPPPPTSEGGDMCIMTLNGQYRMSVSGTPCTPPPPPRPSISVTLSSSTWQATLNTAADSESISIALSGAQRAAVAMFERAAQLDMEVGAVGDTSDNPVQAVSNASIITDGDDITPSLVSAAVKGAHTIEAEFSEDLLDTSVEVGDFTVRGHVVDSVEEEDGTVTIKLQTRIVNASGQTVRVLMSGSVSDVAGNILHGGNSDIYVDAPNDLNFASASLFTVRSDNPNSSYAKAGDTITVGFEADTGIEASTKTDVTFNSNPATSISPTSNGFSATYDVTAADAEGPVEISVSVTTSSSPATAVFDNDDVTSGGVVIDVTAPEYLSAALAGSQSIHVHYSEQVATSASDYTAIRLLCDGCLPQDASSVSNPSSSSHVLVSWDDPTPHITTTPLEFTVGSGVTDLAGNPVSNPGPKEMQPPGNPEALNRLQLDALNGGMAGVALARDTLVHTVVAPPGTVPVIDIAAFKEPDVIHDSVSGAGGKTVEFPPAHELTVQTDMGTVTFPPRVQAGGFPDGEDGRTITVDVSKKSPDAGFMNSYPDVDPRYALIFEFGRHDVDLAFNMPVRVALSSDVPPGATVFTIDASGSTREVLACGSGVFDSAAAAEFIAASVAPLASSIIDGGACVDKAANTIWTLHFSAFGFAAQVASGGNECDDCTPPTIGITESGARKVSNGFSYNSLAADVGRFFTPYERITVQVGEENTARIKVYDDNGPDGVSHVSLAFGLRSGQVISESTAAIAWDRSHDGSTSVTITDPNNVLDSETVQVDSAEVSCSAASSEMCLQISIRHTFRAPPEFDMVGVDVWDADRNAWQNYFNHGVRVEGESLNELPGVLVNDGTLRLYPISQGAGDTVMTDGDGMLYVLSPDDWYLPMTNASALYRVADESMWIQADPDAEPSSGYDRFDPRFADLLDAQELEALETLALMTRGSITNPEFGAPAPFAYHHQSYKDRADDAALQQAMLAEQIRAALLYQELFED